MDLSSDSPLVHSRCFFAESCSWYDTVQMTVGMIFIKLPDFSHCSMYGLQIQKILLNFVMCKSVLCHKDCCPQCTFIAPALASGKGLEITENRHG